MNLLAAIVGIGIAAASAILPSGTYTWWGWPAKVGGYDSFKWTVTPRTNPSPNGYFWAHQFMFDSGEVGYFGIQTQGSDPTHTTEGKIAIFSVWNALGADGPQYHGTFGGEGVGWTVRIKYNWRVNHSYQLRVVRDSTVKSGTWWAAYISDGKVRELVGKIKVPKAWKGLAAVNSVVWTERYSGPLTACSDINLAIADFTGMIAQPGNVVPTTHFNNIPDVGCGNSKILDIAGGVQQQMGTTMLP